MRILQDENTLLISAPFPRNNDLNLWGDYTRLQIQVTRSGDPDEAPSEKYFLLSEKHAPAELTSEQFRTCLHSFFVNAANEEKV